MPDDPAFVTPNGADRPGGTGGLPPPARPDPLAVALARLDPAPAELNRDRLMFAAGAESRRRVIWLWQATAGFMAAVGFAAGMYFRPSPQVVYVDRPAVVPAAPAAPPPAGKAPARPGE